MIIADNFQREVDQAVGRFRKGIDKINQSDNPYYNSPGVKEYEAKQLRYDLEKTVGEVEYRFNAEIEAELEQAQKAAARSFFTPTMADKALVADAVAELVADVSLAFTDSEKLDAFEQFEVRIDQLADSGLSEVRRKLPEVLSAIGQDQAITGKLKGLNADLRQLQTPEQEALSDLEELKISGVAASFKRLKLIHPVYKDFSKNRYHG